MSALLRDRSGVVWAGTWGQGIARHDPAGDGEDLRASLARFRDDPESAVAVGEIRLLAG